MTTFLSIIKFITSNYQGIISAVVATLTGIISICLFIPGPQPEKFLQGVVDFISKFSKKT